MKRFLSRLRNLFFPPADASRWMKLTPFLVSAVIFFGLLVSGAYAWEYTNSPEFCGMRCHSMPPEFTAYLESPHAQIKCVECHIGREFIGNQFMRKAGDLRHVVAHLTENYEYPITVHTLRPAEEVCEECHTSEKFSDSTLKTIVHYDNDLANTTYETYLLLKTGGGTFAEGQGTGIHWHTQNEVFYYATDPFDQEIPYVKVINRNDGIIDEYIDVESDFDPYTIGEEDLVKMDCITCHNRISHLIPQPEDAVDSAISRGLIEQEIPGIRAKSIELLRADYASKEEGLSSIAQLTNYYQEEYPDFYDQSSEAVFRAADVLRDIYDSSIYPEQKVDWDTHPDNLGHQSDPGCFRCHDGQHMNSADFAIRVECNLCHDIPLVSGPENEAVLLQLVKEEMPNTHFMPNWIILHDIVYEGNGDVETCSACHDTSAIGAENTTFCSNSACHGGGNDLIDFETLMEMGRGINMLKNLPHYPMNLPVVSEWDNSLDQLHRDQEGVLCEDCHDTMPPVGQPPEENCIACHGETAQGLFDLTAQFEPNPHDGHEGAGACSLCHPNFGPEIEPCALCHENIPYSLISESE